MIRNRNMELIRKHIVIPAKAFMSAVLTGNTNANLADINSGTDYFQNVNSSGIGGLVLTATGEGVSTLWPLPFDLDPNWPINFRVIYSSTKASAGSTVSFLWRVRYKDLGRLGTTAIATPATALDTTVPSHLWIGTAYGINRTAAGSIKANKFVRSNAEGSASADKMPQMLALLVDLQSVGAGITIASDKAILFAVEIDYMPILTKGSGAIADLASSKL